MLDKWLLVCVVMWIGRKTKETSANKYIFYLPFCVCRVSCRVCIYFLCSSHHHKYKFFFSSSCSCADFASTWSQWAFVREISQGGLELASFSLRNALCSSIIDPILSETSESTQITWYSTTTNTATGQWGGKLDDGVKVLCSRFTWYFTFLPYLP